jgi:hypothetical protein
VGSSGSILNLVSRLQMSVSAKLLRSVADPDPGSGAFLTPGSGIRNRFFPDPGSRIPDPGSKPIFWELSDNFLGYKFYNSLKICPNSFLQHFKTKIICNFVKFVAALKVMTTNFFSTLSFVAVFGSGIRDKHPGSATLLLRFRISPLIRI